MSNQPRFGGAFSCLNRQDHPVVPQFEFFGRRVAVEGAFGGDVDYLLGVKHIVHMVPRVRYMSVFSGLAAIAGRPDITFPGKNSG